MIDLVEAAKDMRPQIADGNEHTPIWLARTLGLPLPEHRHTICDLTGGKGSLVLGLSDTSTEHGLVCDSQPLTSIAAGQDRILQWNRITADIGKLYPLLVEGDWHCDLIGLYPPNVEWLTSDFADLSNSDIQPVRDIYAKQGEQINSVLATYLVALDRLTERGEGLVLAPTHLVDRLFDYRAMSHVWVRLTLDYNPITESTERQELLSVLYFAASHTSGPRELRGIKSFDQLREIAVTVQGRRFIDRHGYSIITAGDRDVTTAKKWDAIRTEYGQRQKRDRGDYNLMVKGDKFSVQVSRFDQIRRDLSVPEKQALYALHDKAPSQLILQSAGRQALLSLLESGKWRIHPDVLPMVKNSIGEYDSVRSPLNPLPDTQRLAYLDECTSIACKNDFAGFKAGQTYELETATVEVTRIKNKANEQGEQEQILCSGMELAVWIKDESGKRNLFIEHRYMSDQYRVYVPPSGKALTGDYSTQDLLDNFIIPEVPDVAAIRPEQFAEYKKRLDRIATFIAVNIDPKFKFKRFQLEDLPRLAMHDGAICAWATGIGKSIAAITYPLIKVDIDWVESDKQKALIPLKPCLLIAPENLHGQLCDEWKKRFGINVVELDCQATYLKITDDRKKPLAPGWYVSSYTQMGVNKIERMPVPIKCPRTHSEVAQLMRYYGVTVDEAKAYQSQIGNLLEQAVQVCDYRFRHCSQGVGETRNGIKCVFSPSLADLSSGEFECVVIDEGTRIKSKHSKVGMAIRAINPRYRLILTATPVKNRLGDIFYLAHWAAGGRQEAHPRFPYSAEDQGRLLADFLVGERNLTKEEKDKKRNDKFTPNMALYLNKILDKRRKSRGTPGIEVCNIHRLWKTLAPIVLRRRKEDIGEDIVPKHKHIIRVPMGQEQRLVYRYHLYAEYIDSKGKPAYMAKLQALRSAAAAPNSDLLKQQRQIEGVDSGSWRSSKDYTPKMAAALSVIEQRLQLGEQSVVFSSLHDPLDTLAARLKQCGIPFDIADGRTHPDTRARIAKDFKAGLPKAKPVLLCGVGSMAEGNNWPLANNIIFVAYDWAWDLYEQAIGRCYRLDSVKPLNIWSIICHGTVDQKLEAMIDEKNDAQELVIDGKLTTEESKEVSVPELLKMAEEDFRNVRSVPEDKFEAEWPDMKRKLRKAWRECQRITQEPEKPKEPSEPLPTGKAAVPLDVLMQRLKQMKLKMG